MSMISDKLFLGGTGSIAHAALTFNPLILHWAVTGISTRYSVRQGMEPLIGRCPTVCQRRPRVHHQDFSILHCLLQDITEHAPNVMLFVPVANHDGAMSRQRITHAGRVPALSDLAAR